MAESDIAFELSKAELIIKAMRAGLTSKQTLQIDDSVENAGVSHNGTTRYHERRGVLAAVGL